MATEAAAVCFAAVGFFCDARVLEALRGNVFAAVGLRTVAFALAAGVAADLRGVARFAAAPDDVAASVAADLRGVGRFAAAPDDVAVFVPARGVGSALLTAVCFAALAVVVVRRADLRGAGTALLTAALADAVVEWVVALAAVWWVVTPMFSARCPKIFSPEPSNAALHGCSA